MSSNSLPDVFPILEDLESHSRLGSNVTQDTKRVQESIELGFDGCWSCFLIFFTHLGSGDNVLFDWVTMYRLCVCEWLVVDY